MPLLRSRKDPLRRTPLSTVRLTALVQAWCDRLGRGTWEATSLRCLCSLGLGGRWALHLLSPSPSLRSYVREVIAGNDSSKETHPD